MNATDKARKAWGLDPHTGIHCPVCGWSTRNGHSDIEWRSLLVHYQMLHPVELQALLDAARQDP
jgi:hypothetical protein